MCYVTVVFHLICLNIKYEYILCLTPVVSGFKFVSFANKQSYFLHVSDVTGI